MNRAIGRPVTISETPSGTYPNFPVDVIRSGDSDWTAGAGHLLTDGDYGRAPSAGGPGFDIGFIGINSGTDVTFTLDLGSARAGEVIRAYGYYGTDLISRPVQAKLEQSDDNTNWTTVVDKTGLTAGGQPAQKQWFIEFDISAESSHRYWRLTLERDPNWIFISEIEFLDDDLRNYALGRTVTISEAIDGSFPNFSLDVLEPGDSNWQGAAGSLLTDGSVGNSEDGTVGNVGFDTGTDITFTLDLETARSGELIRAFGFYGASGASRPLQVKLESSDDNTNWTGVVDLSGLTDGGAPGARRWLAELDISGAGSHRYWRLTLERDPTLLLISELEFWG